MVSRGLPRVRERSTTAPYPSSKHCDARSGNESHNCQEPDVPGLAEYVRAVVFNRVDDGFSKAKHVDLSAHHTSHCYCVDAKDPCARVRTATTMVLARKNIRPTTAPYLPANKVYTRIVSCVRIPPRASMNGHTRDRLLD